MAQIAISDQLCLQILGIFGGVYTSHVSTNYEHDWVGTESIIETLLVIQKINRSNVCGQLSRNNRELDTIHYLSSMLVRILSVQFLNKKFREKPDAD